MDHGTDQHGEHAEIHLPDPSVWPLVVGLAALLMGIALVWWSRDSESDVAGPILGAAAVVTLFAAAGWAYEDGRMRKKADEGSHPNKPARYTQVITFTIADGQADAARAAGGVLAALDNTDAVRDLAGFVDLRLTVSPSATGPLQAIAETTWSDREGLDSYGESRQTILDIINAHANQVVAGSVQAFDMEVIRDTKEQAMKMSTKAVVGLVTAFVIGGFMVGAGLTIFQHKGEAVAAAPTAEVPVDPNAPPTLVATDNKFDKSSLAATANSPFSLNFQNKGKIKHNVHFLTAKGGQTLADGAEGNIIDGGTSEVVTFTTPGAGTYYYQCDLHPDTMTGTFNVQ